MLFSHRTTDHFAHRIIALAITMAELSGSVSNARDEELLLYLHASPSVQENEEGKKIPVVQLPTAKVRKKKKKSALYLLPQKLVSSGFE